MRGSGRETAGSECLFQGVHGWNYEFEGLDVSEIEFVLADEVDSEGFLKVYRDFHGTSPPKTGWGSPVKSKNSSR